MRLVELVCAEVTVHCSTKSLPAVWPKSNVKQPCSSLLYMEFIYILMCHYASVYWIFLFALIVEKFFVYFKTVQPKVRTLWSGKLEAEAVASSLIEGEKPLFLAGRSERGPNS